jgi:hypothetical protein
MHEKQHKKKTQRDSHPWEQGRKGMLPEKEQSIFHHSSSFALVLYRDIELHQPVLSDTMLRQDRVFKCRVILKPDGKGSDILEGRSSSRESNLRAGLIKANTAERKAGRDCLLQFSQKLGPRKRSFFKQLVRQLDLRRQSL